MSESSPLLAPPSTWEEFTEGLWKRNPVFVMVLGMCPTLAVTVSAVNSLSMGVATTFVLAASCFLVSALRKLIPKEVRIATYIVIIATFVTVTDYAIQAISLDLYEALGAYIQLIVANCLVLGRAEAHAARNPPLAATMNAIGMGLGFTLSLVMIGGVREILGAGAFFGFSLFGPNFQPWVVMVLPPGGFFVMAGWLLLFSIVRRRAQMRAQENERARAAAETSGACHGA
ncbi:electron transport complex protein RnfE [Rhodoblastus acidophilus]|uniref:Ion-translocating oxidoreductase complex subunit E n=1 Tax=Rhodoblastus acidophilus TaxID=1074 RepID=A0A212PVM1_RHOAC|nr:electron transport complex subunit E [Rhodoblastus acidophilus]MCW2316739.1 electron transport complex protein RnfE [Rhodoblastus acidophilus]PPQ37851.1 electron transport complex subunit RsxE [Rhodoblastus acidophilus]RAI17122.1 electron transport complex subunit RsxE [Rhodoblastus acidophilus]SNB51009.1 electron transport complex protein RnfE [Rhodoblastus acidophilus]